MHNRLQLLILGFLTLKASAAPSFALNIRDENNNDASHLMSIYQREKYPSSLSKRAATTITCQPTGPEGILYDFYQSKCNQTVNSLGWNCYGGNPWVEPPTITEYGACDPGQFCVTSQASLQFGTLFGHVTQDSTVAQCIDIAQAYPINLHPHNTPSFYQAETTYPQTSADSNQPGPQGTMDVIFVNPINNATVNMTWIDITGQDKDNNILGRQLCNNCAFDEFGPIPNTTSTLLIDAALPPGVTSGALYIGYGLLPTISG